MVVSMQIAPPTSTACSAPWRDATRRDIVRRAIDGEEGVAELAEHYPMSFAAVQKHVAILERAGLVTKQRIGRRKVVRTNLEGLRVARRLLDQYEELWRGRIDRMTELVGARQRRAAMTVTAIRKDPDARHDAGGRVRSLTRAGLAAHRVMHGQLGHALLPVDRAAHDVTTGGVTQGAEDAVVVEGDLHFIQPYGCISPLCASAPRRDEKVELGFWPARSTTRLVIDPAVHDEPPPPQAKAVGAL